jgi:hypothetical protein
MAKRQVAFASARYVDDTGFPRVGHRGDILEIPDAEVERLDLLGALVPDGGELHRPGVLLPLNEEADDEKITNYLLSGNTLEILNQASEYPTSLVEKLLIDERKNLGREPLIAGLEQRVGKLQTAIGSLQTATSAPEPVVPGKTPEDELAEWVASSTVDEVVERAGDDTDLAQELLDAEEAGKARKSLLEALGKLVS